MIITLPDLNFKLHKTTCRVFVTIFPDLPVTLSKYKSFMKTGAKSDEVPSPLRLLMRYLWFYEINDKLTEYLCNEVDNYSIDYSYQIVCWALKLLPFCKILGLVRV
jgi:hypothetical protein